MVWTEENLGSPEGKVSLEKGFLRIRGLDVSVLEEDEAEPGKVGKGVMDNPRFRGGSDAKAENLLSSKDGLM